MEYGTWRNRGKWELEAQVFYVYKGTRIPREQGEEREVSYSFTMSCNYFEQRLTWASECFLAGPPTLIVGKWRWFPRLLNVFKITCWWRIEVSEIFRSNSWRRLWEFVQKAVFEKSWFRPRHNRGTGPKTWISFSILLFAKFKTLDCLSIPSSHWTGWRKAQSLWDVVTESNGKTWEILQRVKHGRFFRGEDNS